MLCTVDLGWGLLYTRCTQCTMSPLGASHRYALRPVCPQSSPALWKLQVCVWETASLPYSRPCLVYVFLRGLPSPKANSSSGVCMCAWGKGGANDFFVKLLSALLVLQGGSG